MKKINFIGLLISVFLANFLSANIFAVELKTGKQKTSYAIGKNIGDSFKRQEIEIDVESFLDGINEGLAGKKGRLSQEEIVSLMNKLEQDSRARAQETRDLALLENQKKEKAFFEKNKAKKGVQTTASGLQYEILKKGSGKKPQSTDTVKVHYKGTLLDNTEFDSSYKRGQPIEFPLNNVIRGWTEGLQLMPVGSKWRLFIPAALAYGNNPPPGSPIEAGATLIFEVELLDIVNKP